MGRRLWASRIGIGSGGTGDVGVALGIVVVEERGAVEVGEGVVAEVEGSVDRYRTLESSSASAVVEESSGKKRVVKMVRE